MHHRALGDEEVYRICVGDDDSTGYYVERFADFDLGGGRASWSWPAFWASLLWLVHRRMYGYAAAYAILLPLLVVGFSWAITQVLGASAGKFFEGAAALVTFGVLVPMFANAAYYQHINTRIEKARAATSSREEMIELLTRQRPTTHPLIILLIGAVLAGGAGAVAHRTGLVGRGDIPEQVKEGLKLGRPVQLAIEQAHAKSGKLPADLAAAGLYAADFQGKYVSAIDVIDGVILIHYGNDAHPKIARSSLSVRPMVLDNGRLLWSCGYFQSNADDTPYGTSIDAEYLPYVCQAPPR